MKSLVSSPAAYTKKYVAGEELGIILCPKASTEGAKSRAYIGEGTESLFRGGDLGIASLERERLEFFKVPKPL